MFSFFRKIRQGLLNDGKTAKYLKYAFGEIILVVIGILIAIQVSNWNEDRKDKANIEILLDALEKDLIGNIKTSTQIFNYSKFTDSLTRVLTNDQLSDEDFINEPGLRILPYVPVRFTPKTENVHKLLVKEESLLSIYQPVLSYAKQLRESEIEFLDNKKQLMEKFHENMNFINSNFTWRYAYGMARMEQALAWVRSDEYKLMTYNYWWRTAAFNQINTDFRSKSIALLCKLKIIRSNYKSQDLKEMIQSFGLNPCQVFNCGDPYSEVSGEEHLMETTVIANLRDQPIHLVVKNRMGEPARSRNLGGFLTSEIDLEPGEIISLIDVGRGYHTDYLNIYELREDDQCIQRYVQDMNSFLIID